MNLGLYIHLPYCVRRCTYCDFNAYPLSWASERIEYIKALKKELSFYKNMKTIVDTIYFGGGTPSLFEPSQLEKLLSHIYSNFKMAPSLEMTLEANPGTLSFQKLKEFKKIGVNRLSLGIQTFSQKHLKTLKRIHSAKQAKDNFYSARKAGFNNINIDLMFGIPNQTFLHFQKDIFESALKLKPEHLSVYQLTLDKTHPLYFQLPAHDLQAAMYEWVGGYLPTCAYTHYEVSAFSKPGFQCQHNLKYWRLKNYLGVVAGASSYLITPKYPWGCHRKNRDNITHYRTIPGVEKKEILTKEMAKKEYLITHLRLLEGVSALDFEERFQESLMKSYSKEIERLASKGFLDSHEKVLKLSNRGVTYLNQVLLEFM